eukprot:Filipodium_phascolosomae@DN8347_c0_g1_i1.p1
MTGSMVPVTTLLHRGLSVGSAGRSVRSVGVSRVSVTETGTNQDHQSLGPTRTEVNKTIDDGADSDSCACALAASTYVAELIIIGTTLGAVRMQCKHTESAQRLIKIKQTLIWGVETYFGDCNTDSCNELAKRTYQWLKACQILDLQNRPELPQIIVDGVNIGNLDDVQTLQDRGLLDPLMQRRVCGNCLSTARRPYHRQCLDCGIGFKLIFPNGVPDVLPLPGETCMINE